MDRAARVKVLSDDLVGRLLELADSVGVKHPPTDGHIRNEVATLTNGLVALTRDGGGHEAVQGFMAGRWSSNMSTPSTST